MKGSKATDPIKSTCFVGSSICFITWGPLKLMPWRVKSSKYHNKQYKKLSLVISAFGLKGKQPFFFFFKLYGIYSIVGSKRSIGSAHCLLVERWVLLQEWEAALSRPANSGRLEENKQLRKTGLLLSHCTTASLGSVLFGTVGCDSRKHGQRKDLLTLQLLHSFTFPQTWPGITQRKGAEKRVLSIIPSFWWSLMQNRHLNRSHGKGWTNPTALLIAFMSLPSFW